MDPDKYNIGKFLGTFDEGAGDVVQQAPAAAPQAPPAPSPSPAPQQAQPDNIPVSALPGILSAISGKEAEAAAELARAKELQQQISSKAGVINPEQTQAPSDDGPDKRKVSMAMLQEQLQQMQNDLHRSRMETYREQAINAARANGNNLVDSLVFGDSKEAIDASLQIAVAEYKLIESQVAKNLQSQLTAQQQAQAQSAETQGTVSAVGGQAVAPQAQAQYPSGPSHISAPGVPPQNNALDPERLRYLTTTGVRTGEYAMFRNEIMAALRAHSPGPNGQKWSFNGNGQLSPTVPQSVPAGGYQSQFAGVPPQPHPGASPPISTYVQPPQPMAYGPQPVAPAYHAPPMAPPGYPQQGPPMASPGVAVQPADLDRGAPLDVNAAMTAAQQAIMAQRGRAGGLPGLH